MIVSCLIHFGQTAFLYPATSLSFSFIDKVDKVAVDGSVQSIELSSVSTTSLVVVAPGCVPLCSDALRVLASLVHRYIFILWSRIKSALCPTWPRLPCSSRSSKCRSYQGLKRTSSARKLFGLVRFGWLWLFCRHEPPSIDGFWLVNKPGVNKAPADIFALKVKAIHVLHLAGGAVSVDAVVVVPNPNFVPEQLVRVWNITQQRFLLL